MTEQATFSIPDRLIKAEEVIAEYVQRYGFTNSARRYFASEDALQVQDNPASAGLMSQNSEEEQPAESRENVKAGRRHLGSKVGFHLRLSLSVSRSGKE